MTNVNKILFSKEESKLDRNINVIFNTDINWDTDSVSVQVSNFSLKEERKFKDGNVIGTNEILIGVGYCNETQMINLCSLDKKYQKYFWANLNEINVLGTVVEQWRIDDVRRHNKAIKEKWTTQKKTTEKELKNI